MKRMIVLLIALAALNVPAQQTSLTVGLDVDVNRIEFTDLGFVPASVETNTVMVWESVVVVYTNLYYNLRPDEVVTNVVQRQNPVQTVTTNAARWKTGFIYIIPAGKGLSVGGGALKATPVRSANLAVELVLSDLQMRGLLGSELYAATLQACNLFGSVPVRVTLETKLRLAVQSVLE